MINIIYLLLFPFEMRHVWAAGGARQAFPAELVTGAALSGYGSKALRLPSGHR